MQPKFIERNSAPARITKQKGFNLSTEQRARLPRKQTEVKEEIEVIKFKARQMPSFPKPSSPQKSQKNFEFKGKTFQKSDNPILEFNLTK